MIELPNHAPLAIWPEPLSEQAIVGRLPALLSTALPGYIVEQRWYGEKSRSLLHTTIEHIYAEASGETWIVLAFAELAFADDGDNARYFGPVTIKANHPAEHPIASIVDHADQTWSVLDAPPDSGFQQWLIQAAANQSFQAMSSESFCSWQTPHPDLLAASVTSESRLLSGEQSNSNIAYGKASIVKVFRRVQPGLNPDIELGRFLTEDAERVHVTPLLADWTLVAGPEAASIGLAQMYVDNVGDGWTWLLDRMRAAHAEPAVIAEIEGSIKLLGQRTAEVHCALARGKTNDLAPHTISAKQTQSWRENADRAFIATRERLTVIDRSLLDASTQELMQRFDRAADSIRSELAEFTHLVGFAAIRVHGDYHLGQTLHTPDGDWVLIDFEGEPARSLVERRSRSSPLKDVAGMIRSLAYARAFASTSAEPCWSDQTGRLDQAFIEGYVSTIASMEQGPALIPVDDAGFIHALRPWIIEKAIYEITYELDNRPDWLWAPLAALFDNAAEG